MKKTWVKVVVAFLIFLAVSLFLFSIIQVGSEASVERYKRHLRASGEKLDLEDLIPPRAAPEKNSVDIFCKVTNALDAELGGTVLATTPPGSMVIVAPGKAMISWRQPHLVGGWYENFPFGFHRETNSWSEVEGALGESSDVLDLLHKVAERPELQFALNYTELEPSGSHLAPLKGSSLFLSSAAIADLHRGNTAAAATNIHVMFMMVRSWNEPLIIPQYVRFAMGHLAISTQWELLQSTNVSEETLALLQHDMETLEFANSVERALQVERIYAMTRIQQLFSTNDTIRVASKNDRTPSETWRPPLTYIDELMLLRGEQIWIDAVRQIETNRGFCVARADGDKRTGELGLQKINTNWLLQKLPITLLSPTFTDLAASALGKLFKIETAKRLAITATALKRYQLRHGRYPQSLSALVPDFLSELPKDPADEKPLRYHTNSDGTFTLYSLGADGADDGGNPVSIKYPKSHDWLSGQDWVWPQLATPEEVHDYYDNLTN